MKKSIFICLLFVSSTVFSQTRYYNNVLFNTSNDKTYNKIPVIINWDGCTSTIDCIKSISVTAYTFYFKNKFILKSSHYKGDYDYCLYETVVYDNKGYTHIVQCVKNKIETPVMCLLFVNKPIVYFYLNLNNYEEID